MTVTIVPANPDFFVLQAHPGETEYEVFRRVSTIAWRIVADPARLRSVRTLVILIHDKPMRDPKKVVAHQANGVPVTPPVSKIDSKGTAVLNVRRAGNRGKSKSRLETTDLLRQAELTALKRRLPRILHSLHQDTDVLLR